MQHVRETKCIYKFVREQGFELFRSHDRDSNCARTIYAYLGSVGRFNSLLPGRPPRTSWRNSHRQKVLRIDFGDFSIILQPTEVSDFHSFFHWKSFLNSIDYHRYHPSPIRTNLVAKH
jgi:hypothetical protein